MKKNSLIIVVICFMLSIRLFASSTDSLKTLGVFQAVKMIVYNDTALTMSTVSAICILFEDPPIVGLPPYNRINDGVIQLNSGSLFYKPEINMYLDSITRTHLDTITWSLTGSSSLSNFNFTTTHPIPTFENSSAISNVISRTQDYTINFGPLNGVDYIEFTIDDGQAYTSMPWYRKVPGDIGTLVIPQPDLPDFNSPDICVRITFITQEEQEFEGKKYVFENRLQVIKKVTFTP